MTEVMAMKAPVDKRMTAKADPAPAPAPRAGPNVSHHPWLSMDPEGPNPPPLDGKYVYLSPDGGQLHNAVEAWWRNTRHYSRELNGGRGGWGFTGWWCIRYQGTQRVPFEPAGWAPTK